MKAYKHILGGTELDLAPAGWDNLGQHYIRNEFYWGISRSLVLSLRFPLKDGGGGLDIKTEYDSDGLNANITYVIQERNPQTNDYDTIFSGILDFTPGRWNIDYDNDFFEIGAIDGSKEQKFFTRDDVQFNINSLISADGDTMTDYGGLVDIQFDPVNVYLNAFATDVLSDSFTLNNANQEEFIYPSLTLVSNAIGDRISETNPVYLNDTAFTQEVTININSNYNITYGNNPDILQKSSVVRLVVTSYDSGGTQIKQSYYGSRTLSESGSPFTGTFNNSDSFSVPSSGYIEIQLWFYRGNSGLLNPDNAVNGTLTISELGIFEQSPGADTSDVQCFRYNDAMVRLIQLATSEDTEANILDSLQQMNVLVVTTGWNLRQYPDKPFNISIRELFKTGDAMQFLGMYYDRINDVFKIVYKTDLFDESNQMFDLGEVSDFKSSPDSDSYFNEVDFGYNEDVEYEELQGANEFNVPVKHFIKVPVKKKVDLKTSINGDTIGAELSRRLPYDTYAQQDSRYDEQRFIFNIDDETDIVEQGANATDGFQGYDEYYNTRYTPRRNLKRWAKYINVPLWKETTKSTKFIKSQKNTFIESLDESDLTGLTGANLATDPIFHPEIYEFKAPLSKTNLETMNSDPHGVVTFTFRNETFSGFILEVKTNGYKKDASWKLIKAPNIDKSYLFEDGNNYTFEDTTDYEFE